LADGYVGNGVEVDEVHYREAAVTRGDVGVEAEAGSKEGWAVLEEEEDEGGREEDSQEREDAVVAGAGH
jgi:hypothetical protein